MRLFLAINFPPAVRAEIVAATASLRDCAPELAWVGEPHLHLTLKFLDEQPHERLDDDSVGARRRRRRGIANRC